MMIISPSMPTVRPVTPLSAAFAGAHPFPSPNHSPMIASPNKSLEFQVERAPKARSRRPSLSHGSNASDDEQTLRDNISRLLVVKTRISSVTGSVPFDTSQLILFFRTKSGITHSLDFPIDVDYDSPPALDVLIATCRPHQVSDYNGYADRESLFFPATSLPFTTSFDLGNHPILSAVRSTLLPQLPQGHFCTAVKDRLEVIIAGSRLATQPASLRNDGRVATIVITLPIKHRGGALVIRNDKTGYTERYARPSNNVELEWTAFLADCDYEMEQVQKGCKITLVYGVYLKSFGPSSVISEPLITPSDQFLDITSSVLNSFRGRKLAFYLSNSYGVSPGDSLAESIVPSLKGGDAVLYHALRTYKLVPELHWSAGGYLWPVDSIVDLQIELQQSSPNGRKMRKVRDSPEMGVGGFMPHSHSEEADTMNIRSRVESSGAISLSEAGITIVDSAMGVLASSSIGKERVPFITEGELDKLVVNALIVVYVS